MAGALAGASYRHMRDQLAHYSQAYRGRLELAEKDRHQSRVGTEAVWIDDVWFDIRYMYV
jgi:hypothetical protein